MANVLEDGTNNSASNRYSHSIRCLDSKEFEASLSDGVALALLARKYSGEPFHIYEVGLSIFQYRYRF